VTVFSYCYHSQKVILIKEILFQVWDDELARVAQRHADQCLFQHDCAECRKIRKLWSISPRVNFTFILRAAFFVWKFCANFVCYWSIGWTFYWRKESGAIALKKCWWNWLQQLMSSFYANFLAPKCTKYEFKCRKAACSTLVQKSCS
jgi:hypothetical protein